MNSDAKLKEILMTAKTIASVGLSSNQEKDCYWVVSYLMEQGYRVIPVNPTSTLSGISLKLAYVFSPRISVAVGLTGITR